MILLLNMFMDPAAVPLEWSRFVQVKVLNQREEEAKAHVCGRTDGQAEPRG